MRVVLISEPLREGVGRHVVDVALGLCQRGHEVHVLYSPLRSDPALIRELTGERSIRVAPVPMRREPHWSDLNALAALWRYVNRHGPFDVIHAHSSKAGALARIVGLFGMAGIVYTPHAFVTMSPSATADVPNIGPSRSMLTFYRFVEWALGAFADRIICSAGTEFEHARKWLRLPEQRLVTLLNSIDPSNFRFESDLRAELGLDLETPLIGFVGRLSPQKGTDIAIQALPTILSTHPNAVLAIIGDGEERARLTKLAEARQVDHAIRWLGMRPAREYFHNFDVLLCPSRYDAGAYTPIEGLYCGLPVICSPVGLAQEVISHGVNGFFVPVDDAAALAAQTVQLLDDPALRLRVGRAARRISDYFLVDRMIDELEEIYFGRLSGPRPLTIPGLQTDPEGAGGAVPAES